MSLNKRFQRLGDLVAGTMVIVDQKQPTQGLHDVRHLTVLHIASLLPANFKPDQGMSQALAHFIDQRNRLAQQRRDEIANHLAEPLCKQLKLDPNINPDLLLQALYYRAFVSDAQDEIQLTSPLAAIVLKPCPSGVYTLDKIVRNASASAVLVINSSNPNLERSKSVLNRSLTIYNTVCSNFCSPPPFTVSLQ